MLITALNAPLPETTKGTIVYIPEGRHSIHPTVNGTPKQVVIDVPAAQGEKIAAKLQADLKSRLEQNVRPFFDFDHQDIGAASALPKRFHYKPGAGIMVDLEWTGSGKRAIKAKDFSYFSPTFQIDKSGIPSGIPERGPLGALVNEPAFRDIPRIAAKDGASQTEKPKKTMSDLVKCGLLSDPEGAKENASVIAAKRVDKFRADSEKMEAMDKKITDLEKANAEKDLKIKEAADKAKKSAEESADKSVKAAIADGRIAPRDEDSQEFWKGSILAQGDSAIKALDALPKQNADLENKVVKAKDSDKKEEPTGLDAVEAALAKETE